jgi:hypothetical protein
MREASASTSYEEIRGKKYSYLEVNIWGISCASFHRESVMAVLSSINRVTTIGKSLPVASDCFHTTIVFDERDVEPNNSVTSFDQVKIVMRNSGLGCCSVEEELHLFQESGFTFRDWDTAEGSQFY